MDKQIKIIIIIILCIIIMSSSSIAIVLMLPAPSPPIIPIIPIPPFKKGDAMTTPPDNDGDGGGNFTYLDRHNIDCASYAINQFVLTRPIANKMAYSYTCASGGELGDSSDKFTSAKTGHNRLDTHIVDCGKNSVLSNFRVTRPDENNIRYDYKCRQSKKPLKCRNLETTADSDGDRNLLYLDRHNVKCNDDEALSRFKLNRKMGKKMSYEYTCCKY